MCTLGVWQLQTLVIRYCPIGGSSKGTREFIRTGLIDFAEKNPQITFKAFFGKGKHPCMEGRYIWGVNKVCDLRNKNPEQILDLVNLLRNTSGQKVIVYKTPQFTKHPSLQGQWEPGFAKNYKELEFWCIAFALWFSKAQIECGLNGKPTYYYKIQMYRLVGQEQRHDETYNVPQIILFVLPPVVFAAIFVAAFVILSPLTIPNNENPFPTIANVSTIWERNISISSTLLKTDFDRSHPQIAFIQSVTNNGLTVSIALENVAERYGIQVCDVAETHNVARNYKSPENCQGIAGDLWFHEGFKHPWMSRCIPQVRFMTLLQNPLLQTLQREANQISSSYYTHYPALPCLTAQSYPLETPYSKETKTMLDSIEHCLDKDLRKNLTLSTLVQKMGEIHPLPGVAVMRSTEWTIGPTAEYNQLLHTPAKSAEYVDYLKQSFYLVGVSERLNEFLVLLALDNGWELEDLYYTPCRPLEFSIDLAEFERLNPKLYANMKKSMAPAIAAWEWASAEFDSRVNALGPFFQVTLAKFEKGLEIYQREINQGFLWEINHYRDGEADIC